MEAQYGGKATRRVIEVSIFTEPMWSSKAVDRVVHPFSMQYDRVLLHELPSLVSFAVESSLSSLEKLRKRSSEVLQMPDLVLGCFGFGNGGIILHKMSRMPSELMRLDAVVVAVVYACVSDALRDEILSFSFLFFFSLCLDIDLPTK